MKKTIKSGKKPRQKYEIIGDYSHEDPATVEILQAYERGELAPAKNSKQIIKQLQVAARNHLHKKQERVNLRLTGYDLLHLKRKAEEEGLPYQTLMASVLHKFVSGRLVAKE